MFESDTLHPTVVPTARRRLISIRYVLAAAFMVAILVPAAVILFVSINWFVPNTRENALEKMEVIASLKSVQLTTWLEDLQAEVAVLFEDSLHQIQAQRLTSNVEAIRLRVMGDLSYYLAEQLVELDIYDELMILDLEGQVLLSTNEEHLETSFPEIAARLNPDSPMAFTMPLRFDPEQGKTVLQIVQPIFDEQQQHPVSILVGLADFAPFQVILTAQAGMGETGEILITDDTGLLLTQPSGEGEVGVTQMPSGAIAVANETGMFSDISEDYRGQDVLGHFVKLPELESILIAKQDEAEALQDTTDALMVARNVSTIAVVVVIVVVLFFGERQIALPLNRLTNASQAFAAGRWDTRINFRRRDEIGQLADMFNHMAARVQALVMDLQQKVEELEQTEAQKSAAEQEVIETQQRLLQELSAPIIPLSEGVIVMPLIGSIDSARSQDITRSLLQGINTHRADVVILDVTGVPLIDSGVAAHLSRTIMAARLQGAHPIISGISDAVAETIVGLGIDWQEIDIAGDLQSGLRQAFNHVGIVILEKSKKNNHSSKLVAFLRKQQAMKDKTS